MLEGQIKYKTWDKTCKLFYSKKEARELKKVINKFWSQNMASLFLSVLCWVVVTFFWHTFQFGTGKIEKEKRKYQQEWCEG